MNVTLSRIRDIIFQLEKPQHAQEAIICTYHRKRHKIKEPTYCQKIEEEIADEDEDSYKVHFIETEGERKVESTIPKMHMPDYTQLMKTKKHNIGKETNPKWLLWDIIGTRKQ